METGAIANFLKNSMQEMFAGVRGAVAAPSDYVPAIVPVPVSDVNNQFASGTETYKAADDIKKKETKETIEVKTIEKVIPEVAQQKNLPYKVEVELAEGGLVKRPTIAKVGEKEPEIVTPVKNYGEAVNEIYKEGASVLISSSIGFLKQLPASPARGSVMAEAQKLKAVFGISGSAKPAKKIGLKATLDWWGGQKMSGAAPMSPKEEKKAKQDPTKGSGNPLNFLQKLSKLKNLKLGKRLKFLKKTKVGKKIRNVLAVGKKGMKSVGKVAKSGTKLVKGASKAGTALLKKGAKKIGAKVGGKAIAKVGAKALGKGLLKKIPFVGLGAGLLFAGQRLMSGDFKGAMLEAASGIAGTIPGVGTAISVGLDATLAAKDMGVLPGQKEAEQQQSGVEAPDPTKDMYGRPIVLNPSTEKAWNKAVNAAAKDGINLPMSVTSSYRSPEQQQALIDAADAGDENAINPAPVGQSPHGQGWAIDIDYYSKANQWMRDNGKKYGFQWQGEGDPVHFDYYNNEPNDKWLQPGKNKWIPNLDDPVGKPSSGSTSPAQGGGGGSSITAPGTGVAKETLNSEPVTQGLGDGQAPPDVIPIPGKPKVVYVPSPQNPALVAKATKKVDLRTVIDPMGKGVART
ncbi:hypothetical protein CPMG_00094 [Prochlorococcus phage MED4-213]|uniref:D-alanyl-D-alanine carboxypeptidase-like core domain-containing protein n=1 Tax=Prochlorococcus phage MED4-213 TaxID=889956 RepID=M4QQ33_9CAUD|nr:peptidase [Prochlorococcus phage MED4-213]AGH26195.1 hypothetical protein CPMG_00094 [Prochlorococcus phage MED4-213]